MMRASLVFLAAAAVAACSTPAPSAAPTPAPSAAPTPPPAPTASPLVQGSTGPRAACMDQEDWEPNEGIYSMHAFAAKRALDPFDGVTGAAESLSASRGLRAMADLAAGPNPGVAGLLRTAATDLDSAAAAFRAGDAAMAASWLADADARHEQALGSTTAADWCR